MVQEMIIDRQTLTFSLRSRPYDSQAGFECVPLPSALPLIWSHSSASPLQRIYGPQQFLAEIAEVDVEELRLRQSDDPVPSRTRWLEPESCELWQHWVRYSLNVI